MQELKEQIVKDLYNKDPYRYRHINGSDGLENVREALDTLLSVHNETIAIIINDILSYSLDGEIATLCKQAKELLLQPNDEKPHRDTVEGGGDGNVRCCDNGDMDEKHECLKVNDETR